MVDPVCNQQMRVCDHPAVLCLMFISLLYDLDVFRIGSTKDFPFLSDCIRYSEKFRKFLSFVKLLSAAFRPCSFLYFYYKSSISNYKEKHTPWRFNNLYYFSSIRCSGGRYRYSGSCRSSVSRKLFLGRIHHSTVSLSIPGV